MKVISLLENTTNIPEMLTEHGLSLYIEDDGKKILFDVGQTDLFAKNAIKLGVDLTKVDYAVLSHGHYDHGGGLETFFKINHTAKVYITKYAFEPHFNGREKYIGLDKNLLKNYEDRFIFTEDENRLSQRVSIFNCNNNCYVYECNPYGLKVGLLENKHKEECTFSSDCNMQNLKLVPDDFRHEQYLFIEGKQSVLFSGCSHKGILNIMSWCNPDVLIGGFHFKSLELDGDNAEESKKVLNKSAKVLKTYKTKYYTCHCTGIPQYEYLKPIMGEQLDYLSTGMELEINC